jgi:predicted double-glycine peptidase
MGKKVTVQAIGGEAKLLEDAETVADAKRAVDLPTYTATVNGNPAQDDEELDDFAFVSLAPPVKGGRETGWMGLERPRFFHINQF